MVGALFLHYYMSYPFTVLLSGEATGVISGADAQVLGLKDCANPLSARI